MNKSTPIENQKRTPDHLLFSKLKQVFSTFLNLEFTALVFLFCMIMIIYAFLPFLLAMLLYHVKLKYFFKYEAYFNFAIDYFIRIGITESFVAFYPVCACFVFIGIYIVSFVCNRQKKRQNGIEKNKTC